ncbi:MAG TPA: hypothetical protein VFA11_18985 [Acidimicrobiales bacterium]|nr:hypothetical protein [Acidimicrobiales bacterium]
MTRDEFIGRIIVFVELACDRPDLAVEARYLASDLWDQLGAGDLIDLRHRAQAELAARTRKA